METIKFDGQEIINRLVKLQSDINFLKEHIEDVSLSESDLKSIRLAEKEFENGKTISLEELEEEIKNEN